MACTLITQETLVKRTFALALFLLPSAAFAQTLQVGTEVPWRGLDGIIKICESETSARDVMTSWRNLGGAAAYQTFKQKNDCGPRILSFKIVQVVDTLKAPGSPAITMILAENWRVGRFYLFTSTPVDRK